MRGEIRRRVGRGEGLMVRVRNFNSALTGLLVAGLLPATAMPAQAGSRDGAILGAGAAGVAIGLILGGAAGAGSQEQSAPSQGRTYRKPQTREQGQTRSSGTEQSYTHAETEKIQD